jgi:hypothetical protein
LVERRKIVDFDQTLLQTCVHRDREMRRRKEQEFIELIKMIRLELMRLREQDRVREIEQVSVRNWRRWTKAFIPISA